ncbi:uncharacterized protein LOC121384092 isoform X2 [Gigantopelta aegis]|uniref:uncharacterized protein LOC121384092 isoform X2 n=1 Tax=Gigantopelta aegis TaxID=1735272 RepID=UPI001B888FB4|nr:uncharacterized protein LOC121384092 isoform X2 [Gigantopelta aegis]
MLVVSFLIFITGATSLEFEEHDPEPEAAVRGAAGPHGQAEEGPRQGEWGAERPDAEQAGGTGGRCQEARQSAERQGSHRALDRAAPPSS